MEGSMADVFGLRRRCVVEPEAELPEDGGGEGRVAAEGTEVEMASGLLVLSVSVLE
jgi:hypothetical protein